MSPVHIVNSTASAIAALQRVDARLAGGNGASPRTQQARAEIAAVVGYLTHHRETPVPALPKTLTGVVDAVFPFIARVRVHCADAPTWLQVMHLPVGHLPAQPQLGDRVQLVYATTLTSGLWRIVDIEPALPLG